MYISVVNTSSYKELLQNTTHNNNSLTSQMSHKNSFKPNYTLIRNNHLRTLKSNSIDLSHLQRFHSLSRTLNIISCKLIVYNSEKRAVTPNAIHVLQIH